MTVLGNFSFGSTLGSFGQVPRTDVLGLSVFDEPRSAAPPSRLEGFFNTLESGLRRVGDLAEQGVRVYNTVAGVKRSIEEARATGQPNWTAEQAREDVVQRDRQTSGNPDLLARVESYIRERFTDPAGSQAGAAAAREVLDDPQAKLAVGAIVVGLGAVVLLLALR